jgi:hypothetical protein
MHRTGGIASVGRAPHGAGPAADRPYVMQQRPSDHVRLLPKRRLTLWRAFHLASALSLAVCVCAYTAQVTGRGVPLIAFTVGSYARPPEYLYGLTWGGHYVTFTAIFLVTVWLPAIWVLVILWQLLAWAGANRGGPAAA